MENHTSSSDSEPDIQPSQPQMIVRVKTNKLMMNVVTLLLKQRLWQSIGESTCGGQTTDVSPSQPSSTDSITTGGSAEGEGILGYFYDEKLNNATLISGSFSLTQTRKSKGKKNRRRRSYPRKKSSFGAFGNPNKNQR